MPPSSTLVTGFVVAIVGFFSSFPIVLQGLSQMGASPAQAASGLMIAAVAMGLTGIALSLWRRMPISVAWSTPGVALLAITPRLESGFEGAVGGFLVAGLLTVLAGLWRPFGRLATMIPSALAQAMLAGVLVGLCIVPFQAMAQTPATAVPIVLTWFIVGRFFKLMAVPAAVVVSAVIIAISVDWGAVPALPVLTVPVFIAPAFGWEVVMSVGLPLFIVTMATQNIPGIAVLRSFGYEPAPGPLFTGVGGASVMSGWFGAPATCLAAITAAMCANEDSHTDPGKRYLSAVIAGVFYCVLGVFAALMTMIASLAPPMVMATLAGVALLGIFSGSASAALRAPEHREAAAITFLTTASGMGLFGLSAAVWGLIFGVLAIGATDVLKGR